MLDWGIVGVRVARVDTSTFGGTSSAIADITFKVEGRMADGSLFRTEVSVQTATLAAMWITLLIETDREVARLINESLEAD